jgi:hypothetical protein
MDKFVNKKSCVMLRNRWCDIIVLNVNVPTDDKISDMKKRFYEELEHVLDKFSDLFFNGSSSPFRALVTYSVP